jgi:hypothetical protein
MDSHPRYESTQDPLDEEERQLMDPDNWDWDHPIELIVSDDLEITLEIDLTPEEHKLIAQAAAADGLPTHRYMKAVVLAAARSRLGEAGVGSINHQSRARRSG